MAVRSHRARRARRIADPDHPRRPLRRPSRASILVGTAPSPPSSWRWRSSTSNSVLRCWREPRWSSRVARCSRSIRGVPPASVRSESSSPWSARRSSRDATTQYGGSRGTSTSLPSRRRPRRCWPRASSRSSTCWRRDVRPRPASRAPRCGPSCRQACSWRARTRRSSPASIAARSGSSHPSTPRSRCGSPLRGCVLRPRGGDRAADRAGEPPRRPRWRAHRGVPLTAGASTLSR